MKGVLEKIMVVPFSGRCSSHSSVDVVGNRQPKRPKSQPKLQVITREEEEEKSSVRSNQKIRTGNGVPTLPKHNISNCMNKFIRSVRSLSQVFVYKDNDEDEEEQEMEIGFPTDVKHVTHIGLDGSTTKNPIMGWDTLKVPEIISFPAISLRQFELAMAHHGPSAIVDSPKLSAT